MAKAAQVQASELSSEVFDTECSPYFSPLVIFSPLVAMDVDASETKPSSSSDCELILFSPNDLLSQSSKSPLNPCVSACPLNSTSSMFDHVFSEEPLHTPITPFQSERCCADNCLSKVKECGKARAIFKRKKYYEQQQFLIDSALIFDSGSDDSSSAKKKSRIIEGKNVCEAGFCKILGISNKRLRRSKSLYYSGVSRASRKVYSRSVMTKSSEAKTWMNNYFHLIGDKMPHIQKIHLPHFLTKCDVYLRMERELTAQGIEKIISLKTFYKFWRNDFKDVLIPEVRTKTLLYTHHETVVIAIYLHIILWVRLRNNI